MNFANQTINEFVDNVASGEETAVGGGSVAAISGAIGAALEQMVCNLTMGKEGYEDTEEKMEDIHSNLNDIRGRLLELADEDSAAFKEILAAYQTPEDEGREEAIEDATKLATNVPMETAEMCLEVIKYAVEVTESGNENAVTDAGTGAYVAYSGLNSALYNVEINLGTIDDQAFVEDASKRADELKQAGQKALDQVADNVESAI